MIKTDQMGNCKICLLSVFLPAKLFATGFEKKTGKEEF